MSDTDTAPAVAPKMTLSFMIGDASKSDGRISLVLNGHWRSFLLASDQGKRLVELLRAEPQDIEAIGELADIQTWITKRSLGRVTVDDCERLRLDGKLIDYGLTGRIGQIIEQGVPFESLVNFIERLDRNPDPTVKEDLYRFMQKGNLPLDPEGFVLGFKRVGDDYLSIHSGVENVKIWEPAAEEPTVMKGRIRYPVGGRVEMNREDCDPNRNRTCSRGLHVCSFEYLKSFSGSRLLIVRVDPEHVTAIPADHNDQKLRCCQLEVVGEIPMEEAKDHFKSIVDTRYPTVAPEPEIEADDPREDDDDGERPSGPADAVNDLPASAPDEDSVGIEVVWADRGYEDGVAAGAKDREYGYPYDPAITFPDDIPAEDRPVFTKAYVEAYEIGFKMPAPEDWNMERVTKSATDNGVAQADSDYPTYDNTVDVEDRDELVEWISTTFPDLTEPEEHELVRAWDRIARDAYHAAFNARADKEG